MTTVLVVDDLPIIRSGITRILEDCNLELQPIIQAADGLEALNMSRLYRPDIILMDIKMANLTGLQATALIKAELPYSKIVILTGYNEPSYLQKALKLQVRDYLLKPVRPSQLVNLIQEIQQEIEQERREQRTIGIVKDSLQKTLPMFEANLVENLCRGNIQEGDPMDESLSFLGKNLNRPAIMVCKIDHYDTFIQGRSSFDLQQIYTSLVDLIRKELPEPQRTLVSYINPGRVVIILSCDQQLATHESIRELGQRLVDVIAQTQAFTVTIGIGKTYPELKSVPLSYAEANLARRIQNSIAGGNQRVHVDDVQGLTVDSSDHNFYRIQREQELVNCVKNNQQQQAARLVNEIVDYLQQRYAGSMDTFKASCAELITLISWAVIVAGAGEQKTLQVLHNQVQMVESFKTTPELRNWAMNSLVELLAIIQSRIREKGVIQKAVDFIQANYHRSEISLQEVAEAVNFSQSHLGYQFKMEMGVSYMRYLTNLRIEESKRLLRSTDLSVVVIAEQVGYPNVSNFYRHFQQHVEMTPAAFRQSKS